MNDRNEKRDPENDGMQRRAFLHAAGTGAGALVALAPALLIGGCGGDDEHQDEEVTPGEDLMREHGVLKRTLLAYRWYIDRIDAGGDISPEPLLRSARLIKGFVEEYHEKIEEDYLFPRFRKANKLVDLVNVLLAQHVAGRGITARVLAAAAAPELREQTARDELRHLLDAFVRMYEPHEAREDTVLFPAFAEIVSKHEYDSLGEEFEKIEHRTFGADGFEMAVQEIGSIERALGIYELDQFTPHIR
ncbi:MAG TPA: hemerythrin domain-containing protein [Candidatus Kapabacteria bacterium]|nr:hemerythrin domain-containing protein [Candidatus Kapabacteria bacterium]